MSNPSPNPVSSMRAQSGAPGENLTRDLLNDRVFRRLILLTMPLTVWGALWLVSDARHHSLATFLLMNCPVVLPSLWGALFVLRGGLTSATFIAIPSQTWALMWILPVPGSVAALLTSLVPHVYRALAAGHTPNGTPIWDTFPGVTDLPPVLQLAVASYSAGVFSCIGVGVVATCGLAPFALWSIGVMCWRSVAIRPRPMSSAPWPGSGRRGRRNVNAPYDVARRTRERATGRSFRAHRRYGWPGPDRLTGEPNDE